MSTEKKDNQFNIGSIQSQNTQIGNNTKMYNKNSKSSFIQNNSSEIETVIKELKQNLDELNLNSQDKNRVLDEIQTIEAIAQTSNPKKEFLKQSFQTIRNILEGISASVVAHNLVTNISALTLFK